ncbi:MAG TPA: hypothetical protein VN708_18830 [Terriglobales bacterium]|jgi:hypothetical protein|nr:hypothetical protein [Terriglobales bacterium]
MEAGGSLPDDFRRVARIIDLISLCEGLTHDWLPSTIVPELIELVAATVEDRDLQLS